MEDRHKILVLDDDADWLEMSRDILVQLHSKPEIRTATSGKRALAMLDAEPFRLLICDLKMPRIDGLQVLAIVRRRFPELRTVVLSGLEDEEFRSRSYALGVDMFWLKTEMQANLQMYLECLESLLGRDQEGGFRGIQSKGLMDIVQMECLARSSTVLRITRGSLVARLWIQEGELTDAEAPLASRHLEAGVIAVGKTRKGKSADCSAPELSSAMVPFMPHNRLQSTDRRCGRIAGCLPR